MNEIRTVTKNFRLSQWAEVIRDHKASGLSITAYCKEHNIKQIGAYLEGKLCRRVNRKN